MNLNEDKYILPEVSVCMCTYNRANIICHAIDSILNQTFQNFEFIIVDDGSTDNTEEIVNTYANKDSRIRYYKKRHCYFESRIDMLNLAVGNFIMIADSDDIIHPQKIEIYVDILKHNKNINILSSLYDSYLDNFNYKFYKYSNEELDVIKKSVINYDDCFLYGFSMFRKKILKQFNRKLYVLPNLISYEDNIFCNTLKLVLNEKLYVVNCILNIYNDNISYRASNENVDFAYHIIRENCENTINYKNLYSIYNSK